MWRRLFERLMNVFKSNANDALDKMEDPVKMIKLAIAEMEVTIKNSTDALAKAIANQKSLEQKLGQFRLDADDWYKKATLAVKSNDEVLAKKALEKKSLADNQVTQYETMVMQAKKMVDQLRQQLEQMKTKYDEAKSKETILIAKAQSAKATKEIAEQIGGMNNSGLSNFSRFEEKINQLEAEAEAKAEMNNVTNHLDNEFAALEASSAVHEGIEEIRKKLEEENARKAAEEEAKKHKALENKFNQLPNNSNATIESKLPQPSQMDVQKAFERLNASNNSADNSQQNKIDSFFNNSK